MFLQWANGEFHSPPDPCTIKYNHFLRGTSLGAKLKPLGMLMDYSPPDKLLAEIRSEHARVQEIAEKAGLIK